MRPAVLADAVLVVHALLVVFVVGGLPAILVGGPRRWAWVRRRSWRVAHLAAIAIVAGESALGVDCPLTTWERSLRLAAGGPSVEHGFVARALHAAFFFDAPSWAFTTAYAAFGAAVVGAWWRWPPGRSSVRGPTERAHAAGDAPSRKAA